MLKDFLERPFNKGDAIVYSYSLGSRLYAKAAIVLNFEKKKKHGHVIDVLVVREIVDSKDYDGPISRIENGKRAVIIDPRNLPKGKYEKYGQYRATLNNAKPRRDPKDESTWKRCQYCNSPMNPIYDPDDIYTGDNCGR